MTDNKLLHNEAVKNEKEKYNQHMYVKSLI